MYDLTNISQLKILLQKHGFNFSKAFGQNFIVNPKICPEIAEEGIISDNCGVLEIGTGIGTLTRELAKKAKQVVTLEIDEKLYPIIDETLSDLKNVTVLHQDILKANLDELCKKNFQCKNIVVCANLPYYITTPVIMYLLKSNIQWDKLTLMVQKEVAERICSEIGSRGEGAITASIRYFGKAKKCFDVLASSFYPAPKVDSSVISIDCSDNLKSRVKNPEKYFEIIKAGFQQRRKSFLNSYSSVSREDKDKIRKVLTDIGLDENIRAEKIKIDEWINLSEKL